MPMNQFLSLLLPLQLFTIVLITIIAIEIQSNDNVVGTKRKTVITHKRKKKEIKIPLELYNSDFQKIFSNNDMPRYLVGSIGIPSLFHTLCTFDLGNHKQSILNVNDCKGCDVIDNNNTFIGCPDLVPTCHNNTMNNGTDDYNNTSSCWISDPKVPLPIWSYYHTLENCSTIDTDNSSSSSFSGYLNVNGYIYDNIDTKYHYETNISVPTCTQCFGSGSHSRFYALSRSIFQLSFLHNKDDSSLLWSRTKKDYLPNNFFFGALVRTVPQIDRIWSNIGIGYNSSFLLQMNVSTFMILNTEHHRSHHRRSIILHPYFYRYRSSPYMYYHIVKNHRKFKVYSFQIGSQSAFANNETVLFNMDTVSIIRVILCNAPFSVMFLHFLLCK